MKCFTKLEQILLKCVWSYKRPRINKAILREKRKAGYIAITELQTILQNYNNPNSTVLAHTKKKAHI